jgi:predicted transcriptional regulator
MTIELRQLRYAVATADAQSFSRAAATLRVKQSTLVLRHSIASIANDLGFTEVTIAALLGHSKGTMTSKYIHTMDSALIMAADTVSSYIDALLNGVEFKQTIYAFDRKSRRKAALRFLRQQHYPEETHLSNRTASPLGNRSNCSSARSAQGQIDDLVI